jgi:hypothetical protein
VSIARVVEGIPPDSRAALDFNDGRSPERLSLTTERDRLLLL